MANCEVTQNVEGSSVAETLYTFALDYTFCTESERREIRRCKEKAQKFCLRERRIFIST